LEEVTLDVLFDFTLRRRIFKLHYEIRQRFKEIEGQNA
jgi:hypothetical protein